MKILTISGSVRGGSYNMALLNAISALSPSHLNVTLSESVSNIPIFQPDIDETNLPEPVRSIIDDIKKSDGIIISTPEYAHGIPGALKNMLDWLVSSDALVLKPVIVASVSTSSLGGVRSFSSLVQILSAMNAQVVIEGSFCVPYAKIKFDGALKLVDEITIKEIEVSLLALVREVTNRKGG